MNRFAALLDRLAYEPSRNAKLRLLADYFRTVPDPDRGYALAAITGALSFRHAKAGVIRALIAERADPMLFELSYDYVGDLSETVALMWPVSQHAPSTPLPPPSARLRASATRYGGGEGSGVGGVAASSSRAAVAKAPPTPDPSPPRASRAGGGERTAFAATSTPSLTHVVTTLASLGKTELPRQLAAWLDALDETGRWALLKLVTGALRIGVSARLAKTAVAALGAKEPDEVELVWPGLAPPYAELFAWIEGRAEKPITRDPVPFRPVMLSHAIEAADFAGLDPAAYAAEWKWDGIRVQAVAAPDGDRRVARLYSRTGEDVSGAFPDLIAALDFNGTIDGELLIVRDGRVQSFNVLQQRLNRKTVNGKLIAEFPAHLRAYDLLVDGGEDLREKPFSERRARLEALIARLNTSRIDISPLVPFATWDELTAARADPASAGAGDDADAVEGVMLKRRDAAYLPGRPKGLWWKWKRDPHIVDAVLMYAQRGHGKRSSFYSDYTFGVWTEGEAGDELIPVGKAYFGFTDEELGKIDKFVRNNTVNRFGPVREVVHEADQGLVLEVAFEGLQRSTRHKSGVAMRFPRISRLRWDKPPREADRLETLEKMLGERAAQP
jgi:DNA ligase-1